MPSVGNPAKRAVLLSAAVVLALPLVARAQYVGQVDTSTTKGPTLRATAVLEYTGELDKPTASRLIPIAVWDGERYQPGGLYMARPVPMTVESGTQYVLEKAGAPKGLFDVRAAADVGGSWIAIGKYQKPVPPKEAKLKSSGPPPVIVDDSKPHFAHVPTGDTKQGAATATAKSGAPPIDPDRPTLQRRSGDTGASSQTVDAKPAPPIDPNRPILREPSAQPAAQAAEQAGGNSTPETVSNAVDPNRPHLQYGAPVEQMALGAPAKVVATLAGAQPDIEQMVAVSDAVSRPSHSYAYSWSSPEDEKTMRDKVEAIANQMLAASEPKPFGVVEKVSSHRRAKSKKAAAPAVPTLTDEQFHAYELSYGGGATLVFTATEGEDDAARYITLIAQPDFNGAPIVLFHQITSQRNLNIVPRMKLIDAADTDADNRAELIFALENNSGRQYAIYRVANGTAERVFATGR